MGQLWLSPTEIMALPQSGSAYTAVKSAADNLVAANAKVSDQDSLHDVNTLACALIAIRNQSATHKGKVGVACKAAIGTEAGGRTLALGRNLTGYVLAADMVDFRDPAFVSWVDTVRRKTLDGMTLIQCHEKRGNNWGTHAGMARIAADLYLGDQTDLDRAIKVHRGWLGDRSSYAGFDWGDLAWQANKTAPVGINLAGSKLNNKSVDGVLPDDQRRTGGFSWPPPCGNYVRGALGPVLVTTELLRRNGNPGAPVWSEAAVKRAVAWFCGTVDGKTACVFDGDDGWQPGLIEFLYGAGLAKGGSATSVGKSFGWTWWTHKGRSAGTTPDPPPDPGVDCTAQEKAVADARAALAAAEKALADCQAG